MKQEVYQKLENLSNELKILAKKLDIDTTQKEVDNIDQKLSDESIWNDHALMASLGAKRSSMINKINKFLTLQSSIADNIELLLSCDEVTDIEYITEIANSIDGIERQIRSLRIETVFNGINDSGDCFVEINAGVGGTDSQDWVSIILRMYLMWCDKREFKAKIISQISGEEAGIKQVILEINGTYAYGLFKNESGIHRLVRISPFNSNAKRQTSFASVFVYPSVNDEVEINIDQKDLRIDTFRSSGAGGQHVNTTDSAVRITHIPTGAVTQSQNQRSQLQNKAEAMKVLRSKIYEIELKKKNKDKESLEQAKTEIGWGNQIRNYVLHPYKLVKDLRSGYETSQIEKILDGDMNELIESILFKI